MGETRNLLISATMVATAIVLSGAGVAFADSSRCTTGGSLKAGCASGVHGRVTGPAVELGGEVSRPGIDGEGSDGEAARGVDNTQGLGREFLGGRRIGDACSPMLSCGTLEPLPSVAPGEPEASVAGVTIRDVASFAPEAPADVMEPGRGIAVRRLAANFISQATAQVVEGTLLGRPAAVRFTPVGFSWTTGDGGRVDSPTAGASWKALRQKELTDTATSHRYAERGWFDVQPTVTYAAEYRFDGSGWIPIDGTLDIAGQAYRVRVVTVETRLTRGDCIQFPQDPGCE
jgi:hypothetical protein